MLREKTDAGNRFRRNGGSGIVFDKVEIKQAAIRLPLSVKNENKMSTATTKQHVPSSTSHTIVTAKKQKESFFGGKVNSSSLATKSKGASHPPIAQDKQVSNAIAMEMEDDAVLGNKKRRRVIASDSESNNSDDDHEVSRR